MSDSAGIDAVLRHLRERGPLPLEFIRTIAKMHKVSSAALRPHVRVSRGTLTLKWEALLTAGAVVADLPFEARVLLRSQAARLPFKVVGGRLCRRNALGCTNKTNLLDKIQSLPCGVAIVDAVCDYPGAHLDVVALRREGCLHSEAGRLWSYPGHRVVSGAGARWLSYG